MRFSSLIFPVLLATLPDSLAKKSYDKSKDAVLLSKVRSLTLQSAKLTTGRRLSPIQQLTCVGGNGRGKYEVDVMRCKNSGSEYDVEDIQWTCQASLPPEFKLGSTDVVCEGYDSPDDPYVLKGSCGVEYRLVLTEAGEEKYGTGAFWGGKGKGKQEGGERSTRESTSESAINFLFTILFWVVFVGIVFIIISKIVGGLTNPRNPNVRPTNFWGGGGGGGGDDGDDPPPPYTPRSQPRYSKPRSSYGSSSRSAQSGPGFWSGAGLGGAAGYAAGNYMGSRNERSRQNRNSTQAGPSNSSGSSWFGGGGGGGSSSFGGSGGGGSSGTPSSSRYSSTGFGGTSRR